MKLSRRKGWGGGHCLEHAAPLMLTSLARVAQAGTGLAAIEGSATPVADGIVLALLVGGGTCISPV